MTRAIAARDGFTGTVTGIDQSPDFIAAARRLAAEEGVGDRIEFVVGDAHELDLPAASFDAVVAHTLVSHVRDPLAVLAQAARVVRPGGAVAIFDGDYASLTFGSSDPRLGAAMERAIQSTIISAPRIMRELPRLLPQAGLRLSATQAHVYAEAGSSRFLLNLAETYVPTAASSGLRARRGRRRVARRPASLGRGRHVFRGVQLLRLPRATGAMTGIAPVLGVLAVLVGIADTIPYVRDTLRGATRPHRGTWLIWSVLAIVVCLSQRADGASWSLLMAAAQAVLISLVFILAIRRGEGGVSAGDRILIAIACGAWPGG